MIKGVYARTKPNWANLKKYNLRKYLAFCKAIKAEEKGDLREKFNIPKELPEPGNFTERMVKITANVKAKLSIASEKFCNMAFVEKLINPRSSDFYCKMQDKWARIDEFGNCRIANGDRVCKECNRNREWGAEHNHIYGEGKKPYMRSIMDLMKRFTRSN